VGLLLVCCNLYSTMVH